MSIFNNDNRAKLYNNGQTEIELEYQRKIPDNSIVWAHVYVNIRKRPDSDDIIAFIYIKDTTKEHMFEPFVQANNSQARNNVGSGLGLAIVHNLIMLMGGSLLVEDNDINLEITKALLEFEDIHVETAKKAGIDGYLIKPVDTKMLYKELEDYFKESL